MLLLWIVHPGPSLAGDPCAGTRDDSAPQVISTTISPDLQAAAREREVGKARLEITLKATGEPKAIAVLDSTASPDLAALMVGTAKAWRYCPPGEQRRAIAEIELSPQSETGYAGNLVSITFR